MMRRTSGVRDRTRSCSSSSSSYGSGADGSPSATSKRNDRNESSSLDEMLLQETPLTSLQNFFLLFPIRWRFGKRNFKRSAKEVTSVQGIHSFHSVVALLKMNKSVILDLLDALDWPMRLKRFLQLLFCEFLRQVPNVQYFHLRIITN